MIDHCIDLLADAGIKKLVANTHYIPEALERHLHQRGVKTLREETILETGGGLKAALPVLARSPVITMNPDAVWRGHNPVKALLSAWKPEMSGLLMLYDDGEEIGDFSLEQGRIRRMGPFRYTGLQIIRTERLREISDNVFSLNRFWDLLMKTEALNGVVYDGNWKDIGTQDALLAANSDPEI